MCSALFVPGLPLGSAKSTDITATTNGAVLYSDGGCRPNPGIGGWGLHGYFYSIEAPKRGIGLAGKVATRRGYVAANQAKPQELVTVLQYIDGYGSLLPQSTNNIGELTGAINAVKALLDDTTYCVSSALIFSDSRYVIDGITKWVHGWIKRGWSKGDGGEVANEQLWKLLLSLVDQADIRGITIAWRWIEAHMGDTGNEASDLLATQGIIAGNKNIERSSVILTDPQGYWNRTAEYNRMLSLPRWYFNTHVLEEAKSTDGRYAYYIGNHGKDDLLLGKPISDTSFAILYLKDKVEELAVIQDYQNEVSPKGGSSFVIGRLDNVTTGRCLNTLREDGSLFLHRAVSRTIDLILPRTSTVISAEDEDRQYNGTLITVELNPPRRAYTLVETFFSLQQVLDNFLENPDSPAFTDITDILYEVDRSKKTLSCKLRKEITSATKSIPINAQYVNNDKLGSVSVPLTVGVDIMNRNDLSAIAIRNPRVWVVTWRESDLAIRYATVIEAGGDIGIWAGVYSNIRTLF